MVMQPKSLVLIGAMLSFGCTGANASEFVSYEGKDAIQEGTGGEKKIVDGIDFWSNGAPPRRYKIIGFINDSRFKSGLVGMIRMSGLDSSIAKEVRKSGGDAVILANAEVKTVAEFHNSSTNTVGSTNTSGTINSMTSGNTTNGTFAATTNGQSQSNTSAYDTKWEQQHTKYAVIKYLPDDSISARASTQ